MSSEPRTANSDLTKLRIERNEAPPRGGLGLAALAFLLGAAAGAAGMYLLRPAPPVPVPVPVPSASVPPASVPSTSSPAPAPAPAPVATPTPGAVLLSASGYIIARREAEVGAKIPGRLAWLGVEAGSDVTEGQEIARLEDSELRAATELARAALARAQSVLERVQRSAHVSTEDELDAARTEVKVATARLAQAEALLADTVIRSPFTGRVVEKRAEIGETVSPLATTGQLTPTGIARIVDFSTLEAEVEVNERHVKRLSEGQPATIEVNAFPGKSWKGEIRQVIPTASRDKAVVEVRVRFIERDPDFLPNMGVKVTFLEKS